MSIPLGEKRVSVTYRDTDGYITPHRPLLKSTPAGSYEEIARFGDIFLITQYSGVIWAGQVNPANYIVDETSTRVAGFQSVPFDSLSEAYNAALSRYGAPSASNRILVIAVNGAFNENETITLASNYVDIIFFGSTMTMSVQEVPAFQLVSPSTGGFSIKGLKFTGNNNSLLQIPTGVTLSDDIVFDELIVRSSSEDSNPSNAVFDIQTAVTASIVVNNGDILLDSRSLVYNSDATTSVVPPVVLRRNTYVQSLSNSHPFYNAVGYLGISARNTIFEAVPATFTFALSGNSTSSLVYDLIDVDVTATQIDLAKAFKVASGTARNVVFSGDVDNPLQNTSSSSFEGVWDTVSVQNLTLSLNLVILKNLTVDNCRGNFKFTTNSVNTSVLIRDLRGPTKLGNTTDFTSLFTATNACAAKVFDCNLEYWLFRGAAATGVFCGTVSGGSSYGIQRVASMGTPIRQTLIKNHVLLKQNFPVDGNSITSVSYPDLYVAGDLSPLTDSVTPILIEGVVSEGILDSELGNMSQIPNRFVYVSDSKFAARNGTLVAVFPSVFTPNGQIFISSANQSVTESTGSISTSVATTFTKKLMSRFGYLLLGETGSGKGAIMQGELYAPDLGPALKRLLTCVDGTTGQAMWQDVPYADILAYLSDFFARKDAIYASPNALNYTIIAGTGASQNAIITNPASAAGNVNGTVSLQAGTSSKFTITSGDGAFTLVPGTSKTITVTYDRSTIGSDTGAIQIDHDSALTTNPLLVVLNGNAIANATSDLSVTPTSLSYSIITGGSETLTFRCQQSGNQVINVSNSISGTDSSKWSFPNSGDASFVLGVGLYRDVSVLYTSASDGSHSAQVNVTSDAITNPNHTVTLSGVTNALLPTPTPSPIPPTPTTIVPTPTPTPTLYHLSVNGGQPGINSTFGTGNYIAGASVSVGANIASGYIFDQWSDDIGPLVSGQFVNPNTYIMPAANSGITPLAAAVASFSYTSGEYNGWVYSPGWTGTGGARYTNLWVAGFVISGGGGTTSVSLVAQEALGGPFAQSMTFHVSRNGTTINSQTGVGPFSYTITGANMADGDLMTIGLVFAGSPNSAIRAHLVTSIASGTGLFTDASFRASMQADSGSVGASDGWMSLTGVPDGATVPYLTCADYTLGGFMANSAPYYPRRWTLDGNTSSTNITNQVHSTGALFCQIFIDNVVQPNYQGATQYEIGASRLLPPNASVPNYTITCVAIESGPISGDFVTGSGTYAAGTLQNVGAPGSNAFGGWSATGVGVNTYNSFTSPSSRSTQVFVDGSKTCYGTYHP